MFLPMGEKPPDKIGRGYYTSRYQHATAISLPLLKRVHEEDLTIILLMPSSTTSLLIVILASDAGTIIIHIGSHRLAVYPSIKKDISPPYKSSYTHDTSVTILKLSIRSISTGRILPVGATNILPDPWLPLLTSFTPGDRSAPTRGLKASTKLTANSIVAASDYSTDGSTVPALESQSLLHSLSAHYTVTTSTVTTFNKSQNRNKQHLLYNNALLNIAIHHRSYFHYTLIQNPCCQPPPHGYHQHLQHGLGQHLQHDNRDAGSPSAILGLLKSLQNNKNTYLYYRFSLKSPAPLASIKSHPHQPSCTPHHSSAKSQTVSSPATSIPTHVPTMPCTMLSVKIRNPTPPTLLSSKTFPLSHVPEDTASHNAPSLTLDEALVVLGQPWSPMRTKSHAYLYLV